MIWLLTSLSSMPAGAATSSCSDVELVRTGACYSTIEAAFDDCQAGDTLLVTAGGGPETAGAYRESVDVGFTLTVQGVGGVPLIHSDGVDDGAFKVNSTSATLTLTGLRIDGDLANRTLRLQQGTVVLDGCEVVRGLASDGVGGGCLHGEDVAGNAVTITDTTFEDCTAAENGGAIDLLEGALSITSSAFARNTSTQEHGGHVAHAGSDTADITSSTFTDGTSAKRGGAVYLRSTGTADVSTSTFVDNHAQGDRGGGAIYHEGPSSTAITDCRFESNQADGGEGGGAVYHRNNSSTHTRNVFCGNSAAADGGAVYQRSGTVNLINSVFFTNTATDGGAVHVHNTGLITKLDHVTAFANGASGTGHVLNAEGSNNTVIDTALAYHGSGTRALETVEQGTLTTSAFWDNAGGDYDPVLWNVSALIFPNSGVDALPPAPGPADCDITILQLDPASPLVLAGTDGDIGAFGGSATWRDVDSDGWNELVDCNDDDGSAYPGAPEIVGDGVDQDCDGAELCYVDADGDGHGEAGTVDSGDGDCNDLGEATVDDDVCFPGDDDVDTDGDSQPDDCDQCPLDNPNDLDNDGVCNSDDICEGFDDNLDTDGDGVPNGCDTCDSPDDTDGDGIPDDCDLCEGFDDGIDTDGDNTPDGCDDCPLDNPDDTDSDGTCDSDDPCPTDPFDTCATEPGETGDTGGPPPTTPTTPETTDRELAKVPGDGGPAGCGCGATAASTGWPTSMLGALQRRR